MATPSAPHAPRYHLRVGIIYVLLTWLFLALSSPLVRDVNKTTPIVTILFVQALVGLICTLPWMIQHGRDSLKTESWILILVRGACGLLNYTFLFLATIHTSLVDTYLLGNATPLFLPFIVWLWLKKPIQHKLWPGLIGGFIGLIFILKPGSEILNGGAIYAILMAVCSAIAMISMRLLSFTTRTHTVLFYMFLISVVATLPIVLYLGQIPSWREWMELFAISILSTLAQFCMLRAFHHASPITLGPFNY
ncbi:MAG TPA: DMT family transporter, partial [Chlamydiales bacterium]|nr:DMT family transporter [Chlamydiales bacterium]